MNLPEVSFTVVLVFIFATLPAMLWYFSRVVSRPTELKLGAAFFALIGAAGLTYICSGRPSPSVAQAITALIVGLIFGLGLGVLVSDIALFTLRKALKFTMRDKDSNDNNSARQ